MCTHSVNGAQNPEEDELDVKTVYVYRFFFLLCQCKNFISHVYDKQRGFEKIGSVSTPYFQFVLFFTYILVHSALLERNQP